MIRLISSHDHTVEQKMTALFLVNKDRFIVSACNRVNNDVEAKDVSVEEI